MITTLLSRSHTWITPLLIITLLLPLTPIQAYYGGGDEADGRAADAESSGPSAGANDVGGPGTGDTEGDITGNDTSGPSAGANDVGGPGTGDTQGDVTGYGGPAGDGVDGPGSGNNGPGGANGGLDGGDDFGGPTGDGNDGGPGSGNNGPGGANGGLDGDSGNPTGPSGLDGGDTTPGSPGVPGVDAPDDSHLSPEDAARSFADEVDRAVADSTAKSFADKMYGGYQDLAKTITGLATGAITGLSLAVLGPVGMLAAPAVTAAVPAINSAVATAVASTAKAIASIPSFSTITGAIGSFAKGIATSPAVTSFIDDAVKAVTPEVAVSTHGRTNASSGFVGNGVYGRVTVNITGKARPLGITKAYVNNINKALNSLQGKYPGITANIWSGTHVSVGYDPAKGKKGVPSGRHAHGLGGDLTFSYDGKAVTSRSINGDIAAALGSAGGSNTSIGYQNNNNQITHVDFEPNPSNGYHGSWGYNGDKSSSVASGLANGVANPNNSSAGNTSFPSTGAVPTPTTNPGATSNPTGNYDPSYPAYGEDYNFDNLPDYSEPNTTGGGTPDTSGNSTPTGGGTGNTSDDGNDPDINNGVIFESRVRDENGNLIQDWKSTNSIEMIYGEQLFFRWNSVGYTQCLPFFADNGNYSLTRFDDRTMTTGNTETEGFNVFERSGIYGIQCSKNAGGTSVDSRQIDVTVYGFDDYYGGYE